MSSSPSTLHAAGQRQPLHVTRAACCGSACLPARSSLRTSTLIFAATLTLACLPISSHAQSDLPAPPRYELDASFDGELWRNSSGGIAIGNRFLDHGMLALTVNGESAMGIAGLTLYGSTLFTNGQAINDLVGSAQGISNIEAPQALRLYESWAEWLYGDNQNSIKFGLYDLNSEFDAIESGSLFINPSQGIAPDFSQSGVSGPSIFPSTSLGLRSWHQRGAWTLQFAVLDGVPGDPEHDKRNTIKFGKNDGLLWIAETGIATPGGFRAAAGYWGYTAESDDLIATDDNGAPLRRSDNRGFYTLMDVRLRPQLVTDSVSNSGINVYLRYGQANAHINTVKSYLGGGVLISGTFAGRSEDHVGLAFGQATAGQPFRTMQAAAGMDTKHTERIIELTYFLPVNAWLALQPDVQHVEYAGFDAAVKSTWVIGLRFELTAGLRK